MLFCQRDYLDELGTKDANGLTITIASAGCALTSVASMLVNIFGIDTDPKRLNQSLNNLIPSGYASNGEGDFDLLDWTAINRIYSQVKYNFDNTYYNPPNGRGLPADMNSIDNLLSKGYSVIVGVSFNHNPKEPVPTHYVEIYRKNPDGTYQMRDPWFKGSDCDTIFDSRYAVKGMSVPQAILQVISYTGELPKEKEPLVTTYKVGDEIHVDADVPTGASPDTISFSYGKISKIAPAKVIGIEEIEGIGYYNIDQRYIGGGTGYARVTEIDSHAVINTNPNPPTSPDAPEVPSSSIPTTTEPSTPIQKEAQSTVATTPPIEDPLASPPITPEEKIAQLSTEKQTLAQKLQEAEKKYTLDMENYQGLVAGGYTKIEDVIKELEEKSNENTGIKKQLVQVLKSNRQYYLDMAEKAKEDFTAIEVGMNYEKKYKELMSDFSILAKIFKTKPSLNSILDAADKIKRSYDLVVKQLKKQNIKKAVKIAEDIDETIHIENFDKFGMNFLTSLLSFNWMGGKSKE